VRSNSLNSGDSRGNSRADAIDSIIGLASSKRVEASGVDASSANGNPDSHLKKAQTVVEKTVVEKKTNEDSGGSSIFGNLFSRNFSGFFGGGSKKDEKKEEAEKKWDDVAEKNQKEEKKTREEAAKAAQTESGKIKSAKPTPLKLNLNKVNVNAKFGDAVRDAMEKTPLSAKQKDEIMASYTTAVAANLIRDASYTSRDWKKGEGEESNVNMEGSRPVGS
jgi:hypothetical protein